MGRVAQVGVQAVIFDWGGTLTPWHDIAPRDAWLAAVTDADLADRLAAAEAQLWLRSRDEQRSGTLDDIYTAAGVVATPAMHTAFSSWWDPHTVIDPDVPALFAALKARSIAIGVLSNTMWTRAEHERIFARDGVLELIDGAVYTSEVPWTKPHPEAFRAALRAVGVDDPTQAVFVGDRPFDDIHGAKSVGLRAVLVPHSDIPLVQRGPTEGEADAVIDRLADLLPLIDNWRAED